MNLRQCLTARKGLPLAIHMHHSFQHMHAMLEACLEELRTRCYTSVSVQKRTPLSLIPEAKDAVMQLI